MKRVGGKPAQLVRSASRRNKTSSRFQFDVTVDHVYGLKAGGSYLVKWSRGVKVASTKPFTIPKDAKNGCPVNQKMTLMVTLYREDGKKFDPKEARMSILSSTSGKKQDRAVAKTRFDLSGLAGVPSATTTKSFKMSEKVSVRATVESRFLKSGASGPGSAGASSVMSGLDGASLRSSDDGGDDLDDLAIDDVPEPESVPPISLRSQKVTPSPSNSSSFGSKPMTAAKTPSIAKTASFPKSIPGDKPTTPTNSHSRALGAPSSSVTPPLSSSISTGSRRSSSPSPGIASTAPPKRVESPVMRSSHLTRERPTTVVKESSKPLPRGDDDAMVTNLRQQSTRLSAELEQSRRQRENAESEHRQQIESLRKQLNDKSRQFSDMTTTSETSQKSLTDLHEKNGELVRNVEELNNELRGTRSKTDGLRRKCERLEEVEKKNTDLTKEREELLVRCKRLDVSETKCGELSREVDRLTLASVRSVDPSGNAQLEEVEQRIATLQREKEILEKKLKSHEFHASKVKGTYSTLSDMYGKLREEHTRLQQDLVDEKKACREAKAAAAAAVTAPATASRGLGDIDDEKELLIHELEEAKRHLKDEQDDKDTLQTDHDELSRQLETLKDRLNITTQALSESQRELDDLYNEAEELKGQRDLAMQRALSKGKNSSSGDSASARSLAKAAEEEISSLKDMSSREEAKLASRIDELETELRDMREDLDYEKNEKSKARDERDKMRETARTLERRTSQAARQTDAMHSLRRELSTHQMRTQDHQSMMDGMKDEIDALREELEEERRKPKKELSSSSDELGEVLNALVMAKVALAEAKSENQLLEFKMKQLGRDRKSIQEQMLSHAAELEVRLGQATQELDRLRKRRRAEDRSEFNELGSDVDY